MIMNMMSCHENDGDDDDDNDDDDDAEDDEDDKNRKRHSDLAPGDSYPDIAIGMPRGANLTGKVTVIIVFVWCHRHRHHNNKNREDHQNGFRLFS